MWPIDAPDAIAHVVVHLLVIDAIRSLEVARCGGGGGGRVDWQITDPGSIIVVGRGTVG
jgi:hypothetical protein